MKKFIVLLLLTTLLSCKKDTEYPDLLGINWTPYELNSKIVSNNNTFITFNNDNTICGNNSCNSFYGNYKIGSENKITFFSIVATKVGCIDNSIEKEFMNVLSKTNRYYLTGNELVLYDNCEVILVKLKK